MDDPGARDMLALHFEELAPLKEVARPDVDWAEKLMREHAGAYRVWACRANGALAGYIGWFIQPHINHKGLLFAIADVHYLAPQFRDIPRIGWRMWRTALAAVKSEGARIVLVDCSLERNSLPFFLALGMKPVATVFGMAL